MIIIDSTGRSAILFGQPHVYKLPLSSLILGAGQSQSLIVSAPLEAIRVSYKGTIKSTLEGYLIK